MRGSDLVAALRRKFRASTDRELAEMLGITTVSLTNWRARTSITPRQLADAFHRQLSAPVSGEAVVDAFMKRLDASTVRELAKQLGVTPVAIFNWRKAKRLTPRQIANIAAAARASATEDLAKTAIRPIVEFYPLDKCPSRQGAKFELFAHTDHDKRKHPYRDGLRDELCRTHGVYVFFDSRGRAIYAGKARQQVLWKEMTNAFNRARAEVQTIKRVQHPERRQTYRPTNEKDRQIRATSVRLHELAIYFSAYEVRAELIDELESLIVRSFANDLSNIKMERFSRQRRSRA